MCAWFFCEYDNNRGMPIPQKRVRTTKKKQCIKQHGGAGVVAEGCIKNLYTPLFGEPDRIQHIVSNIDTMQIPDGVDKGVFTNMKQAMVDVFTNLQTKWDSVVKLLTERL